MILKVVFDVLEKYKKSIFCWISFPWKDDSHNAAVSPMYRCTLHLPLLNNVGLHSMVATGKVGNCAVNYAKPDFETLRKQELDKDCLKVSDSD